jgi:DTW domain-containing protein
MEREMKIKQLTKLYESCSHCGLPGVNCICHLAEKIKTDAHFWFLTSAKEFNRPSNTARLMKLLNPEATEIYLWERTSKPEDLLAKINSGTHDVYLVFPAEDDELKGRQVKYKRGEKVPAFIILDGTWKEVRKIYRKSEYLKKLPIISLEPMASSKFDLRKGADLGNLCTIEAAMEVLEINGERLNAIKTKEYFKLFLRSYKAGACGHKLKDV